jgi:hypothetical protein
MNSTEKGVTFLRRILTGGSNFYVEKWPRGRFSTGVTSLRYTGNGNVSMSERFLILANFSISSSQLLVVDY